MAEIIKIGTKKRGRPKKFSDTSVITEEQPKKKRGRPRKNSIYREFSDSINNLFISYVTTYNDIIEKVISYNESERISQDDWNIINNHIKFILEQLQDELFNNEFKDYHYKPKSSWKAIDKVREQQRINYIKYFYNNENIEDISYKGFMIFYHLKLYITESSKECKI